MIKRQIQDYLQDILDAVAAIEQFTTGIEFEAFSQNLEKIFAVSRAIEIMGDRLCPSRKAVRGRSPHSRETLLQAI